MLEAGDMIISFSSLLPLDEKTECFDVFYEGEFLDGHPVKCSVPFSLAVTHHEAHQMEVSGEGELFLEYPCDRCLSPVEVRVPLKILRRFDTETLLDEEHELVPFVSEEEIDVDLLLADEALTVLPMKVLCKEDCKGICPKCGANLNEGPCSCGSEETPTRMAELLRKLQIPDN